MAQQCLVAQIGIEQIDQMPLGHHEKVHWGGGVNVMKGEDMLVFIDLAAWNFAANDAAKNTGMGIAGHDISPGQTRSAKKRGRLIAALFAGKGFSQGLFLQP